MYPLLPDAPPDPVPGYSQICNWTSDMCVIAFSPGDTQEEEDWTVLRPGQCTRGWVDEGDFVFFGRQWYKCGGLVSPCVVTKSTWAKPLLLIPGVRRKPEPSRDTRIPLDKCNEYCACNADVNPGFGEGTCRTWCVVQRMFGT